MRQYAWYSPEIDVIVLQCILEDCLISYEWSPADSIDHAFENGVYNGKGIDDFLWIPLGEL